MTPEDSRYAKSHEYVHPEAEGDVVVIGITDYAQKELGDVVFVELPQVGAELELGDEFGSIESVKAVSELFSPVSGEVIEVNGALADAPETLNQDPHGKGWLVKIKLSDPAQAASLMDRDAYVQYAGAEK